MHWQNHFPMELTQSPFLFQVSGKKFLICSGCPNPQLVAPFWKTVLTRILMIAQLLCIVCLVSSHSPCLQISTEDILCTRDWEDPGKTLGSYQLPGDWIWIKYPEIMTMKSGKQFSSVEGRVYDQRELYRGALESWWCSIAWPQWWLQGT